MTYICCCFDLQYRNYKVDRNASLYEEESEKKTVELKLFVLGSRRRSAAIRRIKGERRYRPDTARRRDDIQDVNCRQTSLITA